jgi:hypothetical protein
MQVYVWISAVRMIKNVTTTYDAQSSDYLSWRLDANTVDRSYEVCSQTYDTGHRNQTQSSDTEEGLAERKSTVTWDRHLDWTFD